MLVDPAELELDPASEAALADDSAIARRNLEVLREYAERAAGGHAERFGFGSAFRRSRSSARSASRRVEVVRNELVADRRRRHLGRANRRARDHPVRSRACAASATRGVPIPGVPFDERAPRSPNRAGRVLDAAGAVVAGVYCAGWIKRGPSGVIGTNKKDANETVELLLEDARDDRLPPAETGHRVTRGTTRGARSAVGRRTAGWESIDAHERALGGTARTPPRQARHVGRAARRRLRRRGRPTLRPTK